MDDPAAPALTDDPGVDATWTTWVAARTRYAPSPDAYRRALRAALLVDRADRALRRARAATGDRPPPARVFAALDDMVIAREAALAAADAIDGLGRARVVDLRSPRAAARRALHRSWHRDLARVRAAVSALDPLAHPTVADLAGTPVRAIDDLWRQHPLLGAAAAGDGGLDGAIGELGELLAARWAALAGAPLADDLTWWRERFRNRTSRR